MIFSATLLVPLGFAFAAGDEALHDYDIALLTTVAAACFDRGRTRGHKRELQPRDGFLLVTLVWTVLPAFASLPLLLHIPGFRSPTPTSRRCRG
jgi:trk system potassium uptake protein